MLYVAVFLGLDVLFALGLGLVIAQQGAGRDGKRDAAVWPAVERRPDGVGHGRAFQVVAGCRTYPRRERSAALGGAIAS
jgi:hypothetical protein